MANAAGSGVHDVNLNELFDEIDKENGEEFSGNTYEKMYDVIQDENDEPFFTFYNELERDYHIGPNSLLSFHTEIPLLFWLTGGGDDIGVQENKAEFLLQKGADINKTATILGLNDCLITNADALIAATNHNSYIGVKWLLEHGANPSYKGTNMATLNNAFRHKLCYENGIEKTAFEIAVDSYNTTYDYEAQHINTIFTINEFLKHPAVKASLGDDEFNRIKNKLRKPLNVGLEDSIEALLRETPGKYRTYQLNTIKRYLGSVPLTNIKNAAKRMPKTRKRVLPSILAEGTLGNRIANFIAPIKAVEASTHSVTPSPIDLKYVNTNLFQYNKKPMRYNVALALQHPNQWALPNKVANTRKRKSRRNQKTRRSRRA